MKLVVPIPIRFVHKYSKFFILINCCLDTVVCHDIVS